MRLQAADRRLVLALLCATLLFLGAAWLLADHLRGASVLAGIAQFDARVALWLHVHGQPWLTQSMLLVAHLHDNPPVLGYSVVLAYCAFKKRERQWLLNIVLVVPGGMLLNVALKHLFHRARPHFADPLVQLSTYSFPSGHAVAATVFYGVLAAYLFCHGRTRRARGAGIALAVPMIVLVGFSRLYLGAHFLSDVLAGLVVGLLWLALCLIAVAGWQRRRAPAARA